MDQPDASVQILEAQADFAVDLLREVYRQNNGASTVLSPTSAAIALAMVYAGAKGRTAQEMGQVLAKGAPEAKVHEYFGQLLRTMNDGQKKSYTLEVANRVYVSSGFQLLDAFKKAINDHFGGQFESVDFAQNVETAKKINQFVEKATHDKIRDLVKPRMLNASTRLALVNAIYFKGNWVDKFDAQETRKEPFYMSEGNFKQTNEEGSEAAAATIVLMSTRCAVMCAGPVPNFHADHPFHFLITQNDGGMVLFAGTMAG